MSHADPISDMLTRIRNANRVGQDEVMIKASGVCKGIAKVLKEQGYINDYDFIETANKQGEIRIDLKYGKLGEKVIRSIRRESKPSCRVYRSVKDMPKVLGGLGIAIVSTSKGVLSDQQCRELNIGGELLCSIS